MVVEAGFAALLVLPNGRLHPYVLCAPCGGEMRRDAEKMLMKVELALLKPRGNA